MNIPDYLAKHSMTQSEFAALVGVTQGRVSHWIAGELVPAGRCVIIERETKRQIRREDLRPDLFGRAA
jgi:DNA-binding transcriptional regulator YdaS (Cro superfamily)